MYRIDYQRLDTGLCQFVWKMFRCGNEEADIFFPNASASHLEPLQFRYGRVNFGNRTCRVFIFTKRYEVQIRRTSERFYIRNADERDLVSARLKLASQRGHWIQMTGKGHTYKTNFHCIHAGLQDRL